MAPFLGTGGLTPFLAPAALKPLVTALCLGSGPARCLVHPAGRFSAPPCRHRSPAWP
jgi:hypothetical protein